MKLSIDGVPSQWYCHHLRSICSKSSMKRPLSICWALTLGSDPDWISTLSHLAITMRLSHFINLIHDHWSTKRPVEVGSLYISVETENKDDNFVLAAEVCCIRAIRSLSDASTKTSAATTSWSAQSRFDQSLCRKLCPTSKRQGGYH